MYAGFCVGLGVGDCVGLDVLVAGLVTAVADAPTVDVAGFDVAVAGFGEDVAGFGTGVDVGLLVDVATGTLDGV